MSEETSYRNPPGHRSGAGSSTVLQYMLQDLRTKETQPLSSPVYRDERRGAPSHELLARRRNG